ncbi:MAG: hypothetical protein KBB46_03175 [Candidatus Pacebacteria bacterium]|nr:hypothetical protein [Candidatus Paceibacterota bacterium]
MSPKKVFIIISILFLVTLGFLFYSNKEVKTNQFFSSGMSQEVLKDAKIYKNIKYKFSFIHPITVQVREYDEGKGAATIIFEDLTNIRGFQLFILPYLGTEASEERFKRDVPSGVRLDEKPVTIHGVNGVAFFSKDDFLGDTFEVWFIKDGYLYEITTLEENTDWLIAILNTWSFER